MASEPENPWRERIKHLSKTGLARLEAEIAERERAGVRATDTEAYTVTMSLRISPVLAEQLRRRALAKGLATSELVRRILRDALAGSGESSAGEPGEGPLTAEQVEEIARRVVHEELGDG